MPRLLLLPPLLCFAALLLAAALLALAAAGHVPRDERPGAPGPALLVGSIALAAAAALTGTAAVLHLVPWTWAVIAGGLAVLVAPLVLQQCPDRFVDGRGALVAFAGGSALCATVLARLAGWMP